MITMVILHIQFQWLEKYFSKYRCGRISMSEGECSGFTIKLVEPEKIKNIHGVVSVNRRL